MLLGRENAFNCRDDVVTFGIDLRCEPGHDRAVRGYDELLEVPADVAGVPVGIGKGDELAVQRVATCAVDRNLLGQGKVTP